MKTGSQRLTALYSALRRIVRHTAALSLVAIPAALTAQTKSPVPLPAGHDHVPAYHIEITIQSHRPHKSRRLSAKDFRISQSAQNVDFRLLRSSAAQTPETHLLILIPLEIPQPNDAELAGRLADPFSKGWIVAVSRRDGRITGWCNSISELTRALLVPVTVSRLDEEDRRASWMAALRDLEGFPGRRIVVFDGAARQGDKPLVAEMESKLGETYLVDGGVPVTKTYQLDPFDRRGSPIPSDLSVTNQETKRVANYDQGIVHEPTFVDAIRDAYSDAGNYYDLSFAPVSSATAASITLAIHGLTGAFFDARLYEVEGVPPSGQRRMNTAQRLTVQGKK